MTDEYDDVSSLDDSRKTRNIAIAVISVILLLIARGRFGEYIYDKAFVWFISFFALYFLSIGIIDGFKNKTHRAVFHDLQITCPDKPELSQDGRWHFFLGGGYKADPLYSVKPDTIVVAPAVSTRVYGNQYSNDCALEQVHFDELPPIIRQELEERSSRYRRCKIYCAYTYIPQDAYYPDIEHLKEEYKKVSRLNATYTRIIQDKFGTVIKAVDFGKSITQEKNWLGLPKKPKEEV